MKKNAIVHLSVMVCLIFGIGSDSSAKIIDKMLDSYTEARNPCSCNGGKNKNVTSPKRGGEGAIYHTGGKRSEVALAYTIIGQDYWYGWSQYYPKGTGGCVVQWHRHPRNECVGRLPCTYGGHLFKLGGSTVTMIYQHPTAKGGCTKVCDKHPVVKNTPFNTWVDYVMHARWSEKSDGFIRVWVQKGGKGYEKTMDYKGITWWSHEIETTGPYLKLGVYGGSKPFYSDEYRLGDASSNFDEVRPDQENKGTGGPTTIQYAPGAVKTAGFSVVNRGAGGYSISLPGRHHIELLRSDGVMAYRGASAASQVYRFTSGSFGPGLYLMRAVSDTERHSRMLTLF